ncbi:MAG TPA: phosphatidate cytidylyltransferase [Acidimicrobiales bacterium]|nr:phosphatidate cytidylyltransferase [Acidimicrobiales bacterium]
MSDGTDDFDKFDQFDKFDKDDKDEFIEFEEFDVTLSGLGDPERDKVDEDPPSYHSGRVRIIGAEPAGDTVRDPTGPVSGEHPELPHWNDAPTGQVPAILDRSNGDEQAVAPPTWREEETDWAAQEEVFEPSMLSDDLPAVGALLEEKGDDFDVERQPWHFESDDTLVIPPEPGSEPEPQPDGYREPAPVPETASFHEPSPATERERERERELERPYEDEYEPAGVSPRVPSTVTAAASAAAASRLTPPSPPETTPRAARTSRSSGKPSRTGNVSTAGGTRGRDMPIAVGTALLFGIVALACFAAGTVATLVLVTIIVVLATAEGYAAFRRAHYHPATLLGLVAVLSLMIETYNKGVAALPLVLVLLVAGSFIWYLARVEPAADPVSGLLSTLFVFVWIGAFGSFAALLLNPNLFPDRHGIAFVLAAVIVTVTDDVASLLVGSAMGRHPLAPSISPNKSWEGLIGGGLAAILVSVVVVHFIHPWTVSKALVFGIVVAIVAPLGDLSQSMIKRHLGLKDMGRLLPGHGGLLDRFDGLLFVLPATYFVVKAFHLG